MRTNILIILTSLLFVACGTAERQVETDSRVKNLPYYSEASFTPHWMEPGDEKLADFHKIPDFELINQLGDTITEASFQGKVYVADFFFTTCPGICPKMTTNMALIQEAFMEDEGVQLLSHSVTPEVDGVAQLANYAEAKGVNASKWHLLTGDRTTIYDLGRKAYFVEEDLGVGKSEDEFLHTENFILIDQNKHIRGIYNGLNKSAVQQLIKDIKALQQEQTTV